MRLNLFQPSVQAHNQIAAGVGWNAFSELFSCSDDHSICRWSSTGDLEGKVLTYGLLVRMRMSAARRRAPLALHAVDVQLSPHLWAPA